MSSEVVQAHDPTLRRIYAWCAVLVLFGLVLAVLSGSWGLIGLAVCLAAAGGLLALTTLTAPRPARTATVVDHAAARRGALAKFMICLAVAPLTWGLGVLAAGGESGSSSWDDCAAAFRKAVDQYAGVTVTPKGYVEGGVVSECGPKP